MWYYTYELVKNLGVYPVVGVLTLLEVFVTGGSLQHAAVEVVADAVPVDPEGGVVLHHGVVLGVWRWARWVDGCLKVGEMGGWVS